MARAGASKTLTLKSSVSSAGGVVQVDCHRVLIHLQNLHMRLNPVPDAVAGGLGFPRIFYRVYPNLI